MPITTLKGERSSQYPIDITHKVTTVAAVNYDGSVGIDGISYDVSSASGYEVKGAGNR